MARIAGIDLPRDKAAKYALPLIYGIGKHNVDELLEKANVDPRKKIKDLDFLRDLTEAGKLQPVVDRCYASDQIVEAHRHVETGHKKGSVVVTL